MAGLFDKQAEAYLHARPTYPTEWCSMLANQTSSHFRAWDVATGNGQATIGVSLLFIRNSSTYITLFAFFHFLVNLTNP